MFKIVMWLRTSDNNTIGGVRQIYRHVDILNELGYTAFVAHPDVKGESEPFRCSWFANDTRTMKHSDVEMNSTDVLVLPELDPDVPEVPGSGSCKIVVLVQNPYGMLKGFGGIDKIFGFYKKRVSDVICVSEHSKCHIKSLFPDMPVYRIRYSFDKAPFVYRVMEKRRMIGVMSRRRGPETGSVLRMLDKSGCLNGWGVLDIAGTEGDVAKVMRQCMVFMAGGHLEGFGMPACEAMASGCVVVGWHGHGGGEAFNPEVSFPVADGDILEYYATMRKVLAMSDKKLLSIGKNASEFARREYSSEKEKDSVKQAWECIMGKSDEIIDVSTRTTEETIEVNTRMTDVAVHMMANEENAYIERIVKWLSPRVGKIVISEGAKSYSGSTDRTDHLVKMIAKWKVDGCGNIEHMVCRYIGTPNPAINETHMRNEALEAIQAQGFKWVWIVDSDEVYTDADADRLWAYFRAMTDGNKSITGAKCPWHTYWRSIHWRIDPPESYQPNVIVRADQRFHLIRHLTVEQGVIEVPPGLCMIRHYSWAKEPEEIKRKIAGWGHAHQVGEKWYDDVFMKWLPGSGMKNLHPTDPSAYASAVRCELPLPEVMEGHPYSDMEIIGEATESLSADSSNAPTDVEIEEDKSVRIKVVILNHNQPENSDKLFRQLSEAFDDVEIWDSASDIGKIPINVSRVFKNNIYWTGAWNRIMNEYSHYDAVWMLGCDISLKSAPADYKQAIEKALPFGCWSPCVSGRAQPFMQAEHYKDRQCMSVKNIEGMAMAVSGKLIKVVEKLPDGSPIGFGHDFWLCYMSRMAGMSNFIDGSVNVFHPEGTGYDMDEALKQMEKTFGDMYGENFRTDIFEYDERYEKNITGEIHGMGESEDKVVALETVGKVDTGGTKKLTVVCVDNGWGYAEFIRVMGKFPQVRKIVMAKGVAELPSCQDIEVIKYEEGLDKLIEEGDVAFFPKVGSSNVDEYVKLLQSGMPVLVHVAYSRDLVKHMKNGYYYQTEDWALHWMKELIENPKSRKKVSDALLANPPVYKDKKNTGCRSCLERAKSVATDQKKRGLDMPMVTVITPTYRRSPEIVRRCIGSMLMQDYMSWEQLVCSDGSEEQEIKTLVESVGDERVQYYHTDSKKEGDYGNTVRSEMLKIARGRYVLFLDDDNIVLPDYLSKMTTVVRSNNADFAVCKIMHFGPLHESEGKAPKVLSGDPVKLYHVDPLQVLVKKSAMDDVGWDTEVGYLSDGVTLEKLGEKFKHVRVDEVLAVHL